eukprot:3940533-Amphidinium_carterae.1
MRYFWPEQYRQHYYCQLACDQRLKPDFSVIVRSALGSAKQAATCIESGHASGAADAAPFCQHTKIHFGIDCKFCAPLSDASCCTSLKWKRNAFGCRLGANRCFTTGVDISSTVTAQDLSEVNLIFIPVSATY